MVLGSIGEDLAKAMCHSGFAMPPVSKEGLGRMSSHYSIAIITYTNVSSEYDRAIRRPAHLHNIDEHGISMRQFTF